MSVHFRNCWMATLDALISADFRSKLVGGEIWHPAPQCERWSQKAPYCFT